MRPADNIEESIKKLRYETDAETHEKVLGNVLQTLDKCEKQKSGAIRPDIWRTIMNTKTRKLATAAVILIAATISLNYFVGPIGVTTSVYAEVAERLHKALTMTYTATTTTSLEGLPDMDMKVAFKVPGLLRNEHAGGHVSVFDTVQGKGLSIIPERKQFVEIDFSNLPDRSDRWELDKIENLRSLPDRAEEVGTREINGRTVQGFRVTEGPVTNTVWIDPKTRDLVEVETEMVNAPGISSTMTNFQFDVELPDEMFSLTPPDDYTRIELNVDASTPSEDDLIEYFRLWSSWTNDHTFPPTVNPVELAKVSMEMVKAGKFGGDQQPMDQDELRKHTMKMTRGMMFATLLPAESNSHYAGQNVKHGDVETPIFWYRPEGSQTYRIIYGDLSVKDAAPENLPQ